MKGSESEELQLDFVPCDTSVLKKRKRKSVTITDSALEYKAADPPQQKETVKNGDQPATTEIAEKTKEKESLRLPRQQNGRLTRRGTDHSEDEDKDYRTKKPRSGEKDSSASKSKIVDAPTKEKVRNSSLPTFSRKATVIWLKTPAITKKTRVMWTLNWTVAKKVRRARLTKRKQIAKRKIRTRKRVFRSGMRRKRTQSWDPMRRKTTI